MQSKIQINMKETVYIPSVRFEPDSGEKRPVSILFVIITLVASISTVAMLSITHVATITALIFFVLACFGLYKSFKLGKGLVFNEDGVIFGKAFIAWANVSAYYFYESADSEGEISYYLGLRPKDGSSDIAILLDNLDYDGEMKDHIRPFVEAYGISNGNY
jgi:hypothetical protein